MARVHRALSPRGNEPVDNQDIGGFTTSWTLQNMIDAMFVRNIYVHNMFILHRGHNHVSIVVAGALAPIYRQGVKIIMVPRLVGVY